MCAVILLCVRVLVLGVVDIVLHLVCDCVSFDACVYCNCNCYVCVFCMLMSIFG